MQLGGCQLTCLECTVLQSREATSDLTEQLLESHRIPDSQVEGTEELFLTGSNSIWYLPEKTVSTLFFFFFFVFLGKYLRHMEVPRVGA